MVTPDQGRAAVTIVCQFYAPKYKHRRATNVSCAR